MALVFNEKKTTQAAARFLQLANGSMNYMSLIKHLYMLDRAALLRWGRLVTCDRFFEMKLGPVLSKVDNLITEMSTADESVFWTRFISAPSDWSVRLLGDPGEDELSDAEEELIEEIHALYGHYDRFELADLLHRILPELKGVTHGRIRIGIGDILRAENKSEEEIESIEREIESLGQLDALFLAH